MPIMPERDAPTPSAICPACGLAPASATTRTVGGIEFLDAICPLEHLWSTKWVAA